jgi:biotin carboxylase
VIVPPPTGIEALTAERLTNPAFLSDLVTAIAGRQIQEVFALWPSSSVANLALSLNAQRAMPGYGFVEQGGGALVNSKAIFRAIARGVDVPVPQGAVCVSRRAAERVIQELLEPGRPLIIKRDYLSSGRGNEILTAGEGVTPIGARRVVTAPTREAISAYLDERWEWLTDSARSWVVIERYFPGSRAVFAEFLLTDQGIELGGHGEMLSAPLAIGEIMPAPSLDPEILDRIIDGGRRLSQAVHALGYRGRLSADSIVTPTGDVFFSEYNGRITGSTHFYTIIGGKILGADFGAKRLILERLWPSGWSVPSFVVAYTKIQQAGLAFDTVSRTGVILANAHDWHNNGVPYCIVASDLHTALAYDAKLALHFRNP